MKKNNDEKKLSLLFIGAFFIFAFFIIFSHKAEASGGDYFPMLQNQNDKFSESDKTQIDNLLNPNDNRYVFVSYVGTSGTNGRFVNANYVYYTKSDNYGLYGEINGNGYQFSLYKIGSFTCTVGAIQKDNNTGNWYNYRGYGDNLGSYFTNLTSSIYSTNTCYISNFRLYRNNVENADVVLKYGPDPNPPIDIGVAIIPPDAIVPEYPNGTTPPAQVPPSYTPNDYQWTTPPTFDGSSVTNAIGSIQNTLGWLANNLKEEFKNITDNGKHFFEYIGKTIQYYGNAIIGTLNNLMQNFYDNMKALVEPIYTKIEGLYNDFLDFADLFINPFDEEEFENQIDNCQLISQYNELMENCEDLRAIFNNAVERDYFVLYIDFENPFADSEHKIIHSEISFTWLKDYRSIYRPFLWVFTMFECFIGGMRLLGGIIGGKAK